MVLSVSMIGVTPRLYGEDSSQLLRTKGQSCMNVFYGILTWWSVEMDKSLYW